MPRPQYRSAGDQAAVVEHFDRLSASGDWSRLYAMADGVSYHFHVRRARVLELLPRNLGRVADVGCGPGVIVGAVLERGGTFDGVDLSTAMIEEAGARYGNLPGVTFRVGDIEALELESGAYDQVIAMAVLEYLQTPHTALAEIARILRPGGIAVITVPKPWHVNTLMTTLAAPARAVARRLRVSTADTLPRLRMAPQELDAAARSAGLEFNRGAQYHFTPFPYPLTRVAPGLSMRLNAPFERLHAVRSPLPSFFASGYIGCYRKRPV